jgi:ABC-2 type transport system permease protein
MQWNALCLATMSGPPLPRVPAVMLHTGDSVAKQTMAGMTTYADRHLPVTYDSAQRRAPLVQEATNLWAYRGLLKLLVVRDITLRYKRSLLGVWWTLLNPLLTTAVLWLVFSQVFRFEIPGGVPFIVYLLSGVLLVTFFSQGLTSVSASLVSSSGVLTKVYVPPEVFAVSAASAAGVNFLLSLAPLLVIQLITGVGIPWTVPLVIVPALAMLALVVGTGLLVATAAIRFADALDLVSILVILLGYLTPTFYPVSVVPDGFQPVIYSNPLYSYLVVFRDVVYAGELPPLWNITVMLTTALGMLALGTYVFSRRWSALAASL